MKKLLKICLVALCMLAMGAGGVSAQAINDIRINEIQVYNTDGLVDDYGHRVGWIELFNAGYSQVDIGGAYLKVRGKEYRIPKNDPRTKISPQGYLIFFAEGTAAKGTFHTNFTLEETDYIAFYDQGGKGAAIDSVGYDRSAMKENVTYGRLNESDRNAPFVELPMTTPRATNVTIEETPRHEMFRQQDPNGIVMAITAMSVVFSALVMLYLIFKLSGYIFKRIAARREEKAKAPAEKSEPAVPVKVKSVEGRIAGEELAAIAIALYQYSEDLHDIENTVLTINRGAKAYSPWSSKIYGLRQLPNKK
ncbi:OadG family protein [Alistipes sp. OttesenSCG-928-B03]|nr:OadG family protein [Alistipes sp. OttesenSCG-928-B03]